MKQNKVFGAAGRELVDLLTGVSGCLKEIQDQLTAQDLRITKIEEYLAREVVAMFAAGEEDPASDQEEK